MDTEDQSETLLAPSPEHLSSVKVFPLIPYLKEDVISAVDSSLTWQELTASEVTIVRPLVFKYARLHNLAIVYACLVVRSYFLSEAEADLSYSGVMMARAYLCEMLAMNLLTRFASNHIQLVAVMTTEWNPLAGAPPEVVDKVKAAIHRPVDDVDCPQSALEMAISTQAKAFLASPVSQKVVNDMYTGHIVFLRTAKKTLLADNYKPRSIEIYDHRKAPFLDHYRLRVPKYCAILEFFRLAVMMSIFVLCLSRKDVQRLTIWEGAFIVFAVGSALDEYTACIEHGWIIYIANMWNVFDSSFILVFLVYLGLRLKGLSSHDVASSELAFDILACGACILFPRLAFFAISNNVVVLALRAMIAEFIFFVSIACVCFSGLLFTLWTLASGKWSVKAIAWLMVQIWFGNTYLSFAQAASFHPVFGPILMTMFAASNTMLLTILISILSNTFARINSNANNEYLYQFTLSTIQRVKSDALFSYQIPFNLLAYIILKPASWCLSPRALHSLNVFLIKLTSLPILIIIGLYERHFYVGPGLRQSGRGAAQSILSSLPKPIKNIPILEALTGSQASGLYEAIFDVEVTHDLDLFVDESEAGSPITQRFSFPSRDASATRRRLNSEQRKK